MTNGAGKITFVNETQDRFDQEEVFEILRQRKLDVGQYVFDVGRDGTVKISQMKKTWIQKRDLFVAPEKTE
jgi:hypothetical protein